jgi:hypothetical protein
MNAARRKRNESDCATDSKRYNNNYAACDEQRRRSEAFVYPLSLLVYAYKPMQGTSGDRTSESGSHLLIHPQITLSPAAPSTRDQQSGSSEVVFSKNGSPSGPCCGFMASVRHPILPRYTVMRLVIVAGSGKSVLWCAVSHAFSIWVTQSIY